MTERAWQWIKRIRFGAGRKAPLDWGQELWKWDVSLYESAPAIAAAYTQAGRTPDDELVLYDATSSLLLDVVDAAGGIEHSYAYLNRSMELALDTLTQWSAQLGGLTDGAGMSDPSLEDAWYNLENMLNWARILDDRLKRRSIRPGYPDQGLIPALANGPRRDEIIDAKARLRSSYLNEARFLAGLSLHMQSMRAGSKGAEIRNGQLALPFPDPVNTPIDHRWQLTYNSRRNGVDFARGLMAAVEHFMDEMIAAFERHVPERFK